MAVTLTLIGKTPGQQQFGLDNFTEHYKCDATADIVLTDGSVPAIGSAHPDYASMFVTARYCTETSESASALDLTYMGTLSGELPVSKHDTENAVQSASSSKGSGGQIATSPVTIQFYAPTNILTYISADAPGTDIADDPTEGIVIISTVVSDTTLSATSIPGFVGAFFQEQILETHQATEIVIGKFWLNVSRKIKSFTAFILDLPPGAYITLSGAGTGYFIGNSLTISAGGEGATMDVDTVGVGNSISTFTVTTNTFTVAHNFLAATGGSGSGALFNVVIIS